MATEAQSLRNGWTHARVRAGYTLSEIIVVITVIGLLSLIAFPIYTGVRNSSLQGAAMHNAKLVAAARSSYALTVPSAPASWAAATEDKARLELLIGENLLSGTSADYLEMPGGYAVQLSGALRASTLLTKDGHAIQY
jgi:prepilin-type N-terminal cleavage/methylation domain-containing protein